MKVKEAPQRQRRRVVEMGSSKSKFITTEIQEIGQNTEFELPTSSFSILTLDGSSEENEGQDIQSQPDLKIAPSKFLPTRQNLPVAISTESCQSRSENPTDESRSENLLDEVPVAVDAHPVPVIYTDDSKTAGVDAKTPNCGEKLVSNDLIQSQPIRNFLRNRTQNFVTPPLRKTKRREKKTTSNILPRPKLVQTSRQNVLGQRPPGSDLAQTSKQNVLGQGAQVSELFLAPRQEVPDTGMNNKNEDESNKKESSNFGYSGSSSTAGNLRPNWRESNGKNTESSPYVYLDDGQIYKHGRADDMKSGIVYAKLVKKSSLPEDCDSSTSSSNEGTSHQVYRKKGSKMLKNKQHRVKRVVKRRNNQTKRKMNTNSSIVTDKSTESEIPSSSPESGTKLGDGSTTNYFRMDNSVVSDDSSNEPVILIDENEQITHRTVIMNAVCNETSTKGVNNANWTNCDLSLPKNLKKSLEPLKLIEPPVSTSPIRYLSRLQVHSQNNVTGLEFLSSNSYKNDQYVENDKNTPDLGNSTILRLLYGDKISPRKDDGKLEHTNVCNGRDDNSQNSKVIEASGCIGDHLFAGNGSQNSEKAATFVGYKEKNFQSFKSNVCNGPGLDLQSTSCNTDTNPSLGQSSVSSLLNLSPIAKTNNTGSCAQNSITETITSTPESHVSMTTDNSILNLNRKIKRRGRKRKNVLNDKTPVELSLSGLHCNTNLVVKKPDITQPLPSKFSNVLTETPVKTENNELPNSSPEGTQWMKGSLMLPQRNCAKKVVVKHKIGSLSHTSVNVISNNIGPQLEKFENGSSSHTSGKVISNNTGPHLQNLKNGSPRHTSENNNSPNPDSSAEETPSERGTRILPARKCAKKTVGQMCLTLRRNFKMEKRKNILFSHTNGKVISKNVVPQTEQVSNKSEQTLDSLAEKCVGKDSSCTASINGVKLPLACINTANNVTPALEKQSQKSSVCKGNVFHSYLISNREKVRKQNTRRQYGPGVQNGFKRGHIPSARKELKQSRSRRFRNLNIGKRKKGIGQNKFEYLKGLAHRISYVTKHLQYLKKMASNYGSKRLKIERKRSGLKRIHEEVDITPTESKTSKQTSTKIVRNLFPVKTGHCKSPMAIAFKCTRNSSHIVKSPKWVKKKDTKAREENQTRSTKLIYSPVMSKLQFLKKIVQFEIDERCLSGQLKNLRSRQKFKVLSLMKRVICVRKKRLNVNQFRMLQDSKVGQNMCRVTREMKKVVPYSVTVPSNNVTESDMNMLDVNITIKTKHDNNEHNHQMIKSDLSPLCYLGNKDSHLFEGKQEVVKIITSEQLHNEKQVSQESTQCNGKENIQIEVNGYRVFQNAESMLAGRNDMRPVHVNIENTCQMEENTEQTNSVVRNLDINHTSVNTDNANPKEAVSEPKVAMISSEGPSIIGQNSVNSHQVDDGKKIQNIVGKTAAVEAIINTTVVDMARMLAVVQNQEADQKDGNWEQAANANVSISEELKKPTPESARSNDLATSDVDSPLEQRVKLDDSLKKTDTNIDQMVMVFFETEKTTMQSSVDNDNDLFNQIDINNFTLRLELDTESNEAFSLSKDANVAKDGVMLKQTTRMEESCISKMQTMTLIEKKDGLNCQDRNKVSQQTMAEKGDISEQRTVLILEGGQSNLMDNCESDCFNEKGEIGFEASKKLNHTENISTVVCEGVCESPNLRSNVAKNSYQLDESVLSDTTIVGDKNKSYSTNDLMLDATVNEITKLTTPNKKHGSESMKQVTSIDIVNKAGITKDIDNSSISSKDSIPTDIINMDVQTREPDYTMFNNRCNTSDAMSVDTGKDSISTDTINTYVQTEVTDNNDMSDNASDAMSVDTGKDSINTDVQTDNNDTSNNASDAMLVDTGKDSIPTDTINTYVQTEVTDNNDMSNNASDAMLVDTGKDSIPTDTINTYVQTEVTDNNDMSNNASDAISVNTINMDVQTEVTDNNDMSNNASDAISVNTINMDVQTEVTDNNDMSNNASDAISVNTINMDVQTEVTDNNDMSNNASDAISVNTINMDVQTEVTDNNDMSNNASDAISVNTINMDVQTEVTDNNDMSNNASDAISVNTINMDVQTEVTDNNDMSNNASDAISVNTINMDVQTEVTDNNDMSNNASDAISVDTGDDISEETDNSNEDTERSSRADSEEITEQTTFIGKNGRKVSQTIGEKVTSNGRRGKNSKSKAKDCRGAGGWEESLRQKPTKTQLFQVNPNKEKKSGTKTQTKSNGDTSVNTTKKNDKQREITESCTFTKETTMATSNGENTVLSVDTDPSKMKNIGRIVFAKLGRERWWPGLTINGDPFGIKDPDFGKIWIFWFGDHKISQIPEDKVIPFVTNYSKMVGKKMGKLFHKGILEGIQICASRCGKQLLNDQTLDRDLLNWANEGFHIPVDHSVNFCQSPFDPNEGQCIPDFIVEKLRKISDNISKDSDDEMDIRSKTRDNQDSAVELVKAKEKRLEDICISCDDIEKEIVMPHPLFSGGLCQLCKEDLVETLCAIGDDGSSVFCVICGAGGELFVCDNQDCYRAYCMQCIEVFINEDAVTKIRNMTPWLCFLCSTYDQSTHGFIKPKKNWQENLVKFFDTGYRVTEPDLSYLNTQDKKPIRVLSLFDGIGTGKLILSELGLEVEKYYSCEIDSDALLVTSVHHGDSVTHLGDVTKLTDSELMKILPIDLIIGGSPCNDLSLANPARKGFEFGGTGTLFFEYYRILKTVQSLSANRHVFWLFENVASMKHEYRGLISRFFQCGPALWDAKYFSAQARPRFFWGNIPGMYSTPQLSQITNSVSLDGVLSPHCNRKALVDRLRTVTTRQNSLKIGKNDERFPITMNGKDDMIWISELERVFGFPAHYTDVGNLPMTRRQKLLGQSWSVPVVQKILSPLKKYFSSTKINNTES